MTIINCYLCNNQFLKIAIKDLLFLFCINKIALIKNNSLKFKK